MRRRALFFPISALTLLVFSLVVLASHSAAEENPKQTVSVQGVIENITSKGFYLNTGSETLFITSGGRWTYTLRGETQTYSWSVVASGNYLRVGDRVMVVATKDTKEGVTLTATRIEDSTSGALLAEAKGGEEEAPKGRSELDKFLKSQDLRVDVTLAIVGGASFIAGFGVRDAIARRRQRNLQRTVKPANGQG